MRADILPDRAKVTDGNLICQGSEKVGENGQLQVEEPTSSNHAHCGAGHEQCKVGRLMKLHHFRVSWNSIQKISSKAVK